MRRLWRKVLKLRWLFARHWFQLRDLMALKVRTTDPEDGKRYVFRCDSLHAYVRAKDLIGKEPETIDWLRAEVRPDDVLLDIGANVGTFSIFAAQRIGPEGHVYSCEPHLPTTVQLLQNIAANGLQDRISVLSVAASGEDAFIPFHYKRWRAGASGSQLDIASGPGLAAPVGTELKSGLCVDTMIERGAIRAPTLIKIDTDGIEMAILSGMRELLTGSSQPRSILVEAQEGEFTKQKTLMAEFGYGVRETHVVGRWKDMQDHGASLDELAFNVLYGPEG